MTIKYELYKAVYLGVKCQIICNMLESHNLQQKLLCFIWQFWVNSMACAEVQKKGEGTGKI